mgnify:CR=1 FL=1
MEVEEMGKKLTHREKKKLKKHQEYEKKRMEMLTKIGGQGHRELETSFTVSQTQSQQRGNKQLENARSTIKIEFFSL